MSVRFIQSVCLLTCAWNTHTHLSFSLLEKFADLSKAVDVYFAWIDHIAEENKAVDENEEEEEEEAEATATGASAAGIYSDDE